MAKKNNNIVVERIGEHTGRPITTTAVPVRWTLNSRRAPLNVQPNGTIIQSIVNKDGTNEQTFYKSNMEPSFGFIINGIDSTAIKYNPHSDIGYTKKYKPDTPKFKEIANKAAQYNVPVTTYGEAYDNLEEVERQTEKFQPGGSIASRLWNKWTGKDKYEDGYGVPRSHTPVRESAHRTIVKAADSPLVQAIPVVGDIADGYVAADYAKKGDYKPAIAAIGAGLVSPDFLEVGARFIPKDTWRDALKKLDDIDLTTTIKRDLPDDAKKYLDDVKSGNVKLTKDINEMTDNEKEALLHQLNSNSSLLSRSGKHRTPSQNYRNTTPVDDDIDKVWIPQKTYNDDGDIIDYGTSKQSNEPWWGWDPVEYQNGGEIPSNDQQQQLFVAIITDMAKTLGVEPSQELAEAVMTAFENNDDSQGLLTLFTKTKDKFMNETGLFREGGKMIAFVEKFGCGGKSPKKKTSKKQEGGEVELTRRQARDLSKLNKGYDNGDFRMAYQNAKNTLANNTDLSGRERRMAARRMVSGINDNAPTTPTLKPMDAQLNVASPALNPVQALGPSRPAPAVSTPMGPIDRIQGRVNNAIDGYQRGTDRIIDGIQAGGNRVYDAVQDGARRIGDGIQTGGNAIVDGMQGVSRRAGDWVQNAGNKVFDGIQSASNVFGIRPEFVDRAIDDVQAGVNRAYDNAQDFGARVVDGIQSGANRAYDAVQDGARRIGDGVQNVGNRIIDGGQRVRNAVIDGTQNFGNRVVDGVQAGAQRLGQGIQRAGQRISEWFR